MNAFGTIDIIDTIDTLGAISTFGLLDTLCSLVWHNGNRPIPGEHFTDELAETIKLTDENWTSSRLYKLINLEVQQRNDGHLIDGLGAHIAPRPVIEAGPRKRVHVKVLVLAHAGAVKHGRSVFAHHVGEEGRLDHGADERRFGLRHAIAGDA